MSLESTKSIMSKYIASNHSDLSMMADDVEFTDMTSGEKYAGPEAVSQMLNYIYHIAFDAHAETRSLVISETNAVFEAMFKGKHIGEFAGIQATNKSVNVPLCVVYDIENDKIKKGRIYFEIPVLMAQLNGN